MCFKAVEVDPWHLHHVPNHLKTQEMWVKAVKDNLSSLWYVSTWFVTQQYVQIYKDGVKTVSIMMMMMMNLLSGTKFIKNKRSRKHK